MKGIIIILLTVVIGFLPVWASAEVRIADIPNGSIEMMNISDGNLYVQILKDYPRVSALYRYDYSKDDAFDLICEKQIENNILFSIVINGSVYYIKNGETVLELLQAADGADAKAEIELFPDQFIDVLNNVQPYILSNCENNVLTYMVRAENKKNKEVSFLCRLDLNTREFKSIEVFELMSFFNTDDGKTVYFNNMEDKNRELLTHINLIDWQTMGIEQIGSIPATARSYIYDEKNSSYLYVINKKIMRSSLVQNDEVVMDLSDIMVGPRSVTDQRGLLINRNQYIIFIDIITNENEIVSKVLSMSI